MHLPNGSYVTFGGGNDTTRDGRLGVRIVNPCTISDIPTDEKCKWVENPAQLSMKRRRWYSTAEATGEGRIVIIGGMSAGGYLNRMLPNVDPAYEGGQAEPTYEYFPPMDGDPQVSQFVVKTSGLNAFAHTYLMPSGKMLLQANLSTGKSHLLGRLDPAKAYPTALWDHVANKESPLPDMPKGIIRVYPASGATVMLPLTPANKWTPTILFCGGSTIRDQDWGDYSGPNIATWRVPASKDCQRLTPEPIDGSLPHYEQDDDMLEPRTLGQFVLLPTGQLLLLNGARNGTAGYQRDQTKIGPIPFGLSLAADPVTRPAIYDPNAPKGSRWSNEGFGSSDIPRLYHATAILLPDGSVMAAGSNPNPNVNLTAFFPTEYRADIFYPSYFSAKSRPNPQNLPKALSYGGPYFDILIPADSYSGSGNDAADATIVTIVRSGFTTHAMNMGQRFMQLNNSYTVHGNGSITLHVSQLPPNPNLFQPGPAFLYVCMKGIPSIGKLVIIGNGNIGPQPTSIASQPPSSVQGDGSGSAPGPGSRQTTIIAAMSAVAAGLIIILIVAFIYVRRRRRAQAVPIHGRTLPGLNTEDVDNLLYPSRRPAIDPLDFLIPTEPRLDSNRESNTASHRLSHYGDSFISTTGQTSSQLYSDGGTRSSYAGVVKQPFDSVPVGLGAVGFGDRGSEKQDGRNMPHADNFMDGLQLEQPPSYRMAVAGVTQPI